LVIIWQLKNLKNFKFRQFFFKNRQKKKRWVRPLKVIITCVGCAGHSLSSRISPSAEGIPYYQCFFKGVILWSQSSYHPQKDAAKLMIIIHRKMLLIKTTKKFNESFYISGYLLESPAMFWPLHQIMGAEFRRFNLRFSVDFLQQMRSD